MVAWGLNRLGKSIYLILTTLSLPLLTIFLRLSLQEAEAGGGGLEAQ